MHIQKPKELLSLSAFIKHLIENLFIGFAIIGISLGIGMLGYRYFEHMNWVDAYENASMILSGMGLFLPLLRKAVRSLQEATPCLVESCS